MPIGIKPADARIFINADDLGYNEKINQAIYTSFRLGLINSASLMVNMPGTSDAIRMIGLDTIFSSNIGLHLNLTEGYPLSDAIKSCRRFCDESGAFIFNRQKPLFSLTKLEKNAVYLEMIAQIEILKAAGIHPGHIDSHHHVHTEWPVLKLSVRLASAYNVKNIRLARNIGKQQGFAKKLYRSLLNIYLKYYAGTAHRDYFGSLDDFDISRQGRLFNKKLIEIMVHPMITQNRDLVDSNGNCLEKSIAAIIPASKRNLVET